MKNMKKLLAILMAAVMCFGILAACGNSGDGGKTPTTPGGTDQPDPQGGDDNPTKPTDPEPAVGGQIVYGSTTELSGDLGNAWWTNNAADKMLRDLIDDYAVIVSNQSGEFVENKSVVEKIESKENEDGTKTFTVTIKKGLVYNNGDPITAADYVAYELVALSPALKAAGAKASGETIVGGDEYQNGKLICENKDENHEHGPECREKVKVLSGLRLLDEYTYAITISKDFLPYYFDITYASLKPIALKQYASAPLTVKDDGEGAYLDGGELDSEELKKSRYIYKDRISAGPYSLVDFDQAQLTATVKINKNYAGNFEGQKPHVETIVIVKADQTTMMDALKTGSIDFLSALTDGDQINAALDMADAGGFKTVKYERNGYGKLMFQCDFGPTQFKAVRHAVAYLLDRNEFANQFCKGFGSVVDGPYGLCMWMYKDSKSELQQRLNAYSYSVEKAIAELEADGWTLNEKGEAYESGIRYKKVTAEEAGDYKHNVKLADGTILMPLIIEWASSENNSVSELLSVMLAKGAQTAQAGMQINQNTMSFSDLLNYMYRDASQGDQYGVKTYGMYNLATNFTAAYDMSFSYALEGTSYWDMGYNTNFTDSKELDDLSMDMVYKVESGDTEGYRKIWVDFIDAWNEYLPEVPLYSNLYHDAMADKIQNLECNALFDFEQAVVYAYVK